MIYCWKLIRMLLSLSTLGAATLTISMLLGATDISRAAGAQKASSSCDRAYAEFSNGQWAPPDQAIHFYLRAIDLCPGFIRPYELAGNYYRKQDNADQAVAFFKKAAQLGSVNHKLYYLLGSLHFKKGQYTQALYYTNKSLDLNDSYEKAIELKQRLHQIRDTEGPIITLYEPAADLLNRVAHFYETFTFRGLVKDQNEIASLTIAGHDAAIQSDGNFLADIPLKPGLNQITIECLDTLGNKTTRKVRIHRATAITDAGIYRRSYAVIIGINAYEKWPQLESAVLDAKAVQSIFEQTGFHEVKLILNKEATQRRILTELYDELPQKVSRDDRIVFYFAGHGMTEKSGNKPPTGYIIPVESGLTDFPATAISMSQIRNLCSHIIAKHIIFVMDCCYAGQILEQGAKDRQHNGDGFERSTYKRVVQIITAGAKDQLALEGEKHGLFTEYFLQSLRGDADLNGDNVVTGHEIGKYIPPIVAHLTNRSQTPLFSHIEGSGDILFFVNNNNL